MIGPLPKGPQECEDDAYWEDHDEDYDADDGPEPDDVTRDDDGDCYGY